MTNNNIEYYLNSFSQKENLSFLKELLNTCGSGFIKTIYIDPPFTTKQIFKNKNGEFAYSDTLNDDDFLLFLRERIEIAYQLLSDDGFFFLHIDNKIGHYVKILLDNIFDKENFLTTIITSRIKKNDTNSLMFNESFDYLFLYRKSKRAKLKPLFKESNKKPYWHSLEASGQGDGKYFNGEFILPSSGNHWRWSQERIDKELAQGTLRINSKGKPEYLVTPKREKIDNNWLDIPGYSFKNKYPTEKSKQVMQRIIECSTEENDIILDFFSGSGSFLETGLDLNRKVIGCDIGKLSLKTIETRLKNKIKIIINE